MSGPVLDFDPRRVRRVPTGEPVDTRDAPGVVDTISAAFTAARADTAGAVEAYQVDAYKPIIDALIELQPGAQFTRYVNPSSGTVDPQSVWRDVERFRRQGRFAELPATVQEFEKQWRAAKAREIGEAEQTAARGNGIAAFIGGLGGAMTDPVNLYTLPVGGFGKTAAKRIITEGVVNMGIEAAMLPGVQRNREALGRPDLTAEEAGLGIAFAGIGAAGFRGAFELAPAAGRFANEQLVQPLRRALDPNLPDKELAKAFTEMVPAELRTPEQEAALFIINRSEEIRAANPYVDTLDALDVHVGKMQTAMDAIEEGRIAGPVEIETAGVAPMVRAPVTAAARGIDLEAVKAAIRGPESGGDDRASNAMGSSAAGRYQFIRSTFISTYAREYGVSEAAAARAWESSRFDVSVQERLMDRLTLDNAAALERAGIAPDPGNLYLAHFAGSAKAIELLRVDPDLPVSQFFSKKAIAQNPTYLGGGKTVGEAIEIIRAKVGDPGQRSPVPMAPDTPPLRDPALDAERPVSVLVPDSRIDSGLAPEIEALVPGLIEVVNTPGRSLNQLGPLATDLGTDEATLKLALQALVEKGAITQNARTGIFMRKAAAPVTAANQKRPRTLLEFLAERGGLNDYGGELRALGIRTSDRRMGAKVIRNVRREDGTVKAGDGVYGLDTAFQDALEAGYFPEFEGMATKGYGDLLDTPALLLNAISQELSGAPRYRMDDWGRLAEFKLQGATEGEFGGYVRAADDAGDDDPTMGPAIFERFRSDWQDYGYDMADLPEGELFDRAARLWADGRGMEPMHAVAQAAQEEYEELIALAVSEQLAQEYAYYDPWNPEWDAEFERRYAAALGRDRANGQDGDGWPDDAGDPAPRRDGGQDPAGDRQDVAAQGLTPREIDELAAARPRSDHSDLPPDPDPKFADVDSPGIVAAAESAWHDIRVAQGRYGRPSRMKILEQSISEINALMARAEQANPEVARQIAAGDIDRARARAIDPDDPNSLWRELSEDVRDFLAMRPARDAETGETIMGMDSIRGTHMFDLYEEMDQLRFAEAELAEADPNIAARQRQEAQLGAEAPMRATAEQDGTMGLGLFDAVDQQSLFDLGDGRGERSIADIRAEIDGDRSMIDTLRSCMT